MVVIGYVMAVAVHRPNQIFFQAVGMAMLCNHLGMFLQGLKDRRNMRRGRSNGPDEQRKAR